MSENAGQTERNTPVSGGVAAKPHPQSEFAKYIEQAKTDVAEALRLISLELPQSRRDAARVALLYACEHEGVGNVQAIADSIQNDQLRRRSLGSVSYELANQDPMDLFVFAKKNMRAETRNSVMYEALRGTIRKGDFESSKALIAEMPFSKARLDAIADFSLALSKRDGTGMLAWAKSLTLNEDRDRAFLSAIPGIVSVNGLDGLVEILSETNNNNVQLGCINEAVKLVLSNDDATTAQHWLEGLPPQFQGKALVGLIEESANTSFPEWATSALSLGTTSDREVAISALAFRWATKEPDNCANWALDLPADVRNTAIGTVVRRWYDIDSGQLSNWISALPDGQNRDYALQHLAYHVRRVDGATALDLANQIQNSEMKERTVGTLRIK